MSVMLMLEGKTATFGVFLLFGYFMGTGSGMADTFQSAFMADLNPANTAVFLGILHGIYGIGSLVMPLALQGMLRYFAWRTVYCIIGFICLILIMQFIFVHKQFRSRVPASTYLESPMDFTEMKNFVTNPGFISVMLCMFFGAAGQSGILVWTVRYVSTVLQATQMAFICLSLFWGASTISRFIAPCLPWEKSRIMCIGALLTGIAWFAGITAGTPQAMCAACVVAGLGSGSGIPLTLNEGTQIDEKHRGLTTSILMIVKTVSQVLTPVIIAMLLNMIGLKKGILTTSALFVMNAAAACWVMQQRAEIVTGN